MQTSDDKIAGPQLQPSALGRARAARIGRACWRAAKLSLWGVNRVVYYSLPPALHTGLRLCLPRICQRQEQRRFVHNLRLILGPPRVEQPPIKPPILKMPVVEVPVVEAPISETPVVESPVIEVPTIEPPVVEAPPVPPVKPPVIELPVIEQPVVLTPVDPPAPEALPAPTGSLSYFDDTVPALELPPRPPEPPVVHDMTRAITWPPVDPIYLREGDAILHRYREITMWPELSNRDVQNKVEAYLQIGGGSRVDRVRRLRELARLEQMRGKELLACTYRLRALRLLGCDRYRDLVGVRQTLLALGFPAVAEAADAMFGPAGARFNHCRQFLQNALEDNRQPPAPVEFEFFEDCRGGRPYRVAVIVSLYNAAGKLSCLMQSLQCQTLVRKNEVEFIFIDSHSPANEYEALRRVAAEFPFPYVFARTYERETIQTAWNRAIGLARAPYLTFLGVDETIVPECLAVLSNELDNDAALDWVQGNSLLTEVNPDGVFLKDVMLYDRTGYTADHVYLETAYLSWVGSLYRKSIHDRFGYYDGSFGAAGDTEFKGRLLPFLKTKSLPQTLGVFLNYPEERATASPKAEVEDLRAWYLHRSPAGVDYAMQRRDPVEAEKLLLLALHYRKSYLKQFSTDLEYARSVADYLAANVPGSPTLVLAGGIARLLDAYRALDDVRPLTARQFADTARRAQQTIARVQRDHRDTPWLQHVTYTIYNDNRYEQHSFAY